MAKLNGNGARVALIALGILAAIFCAWVGTIDRRVTANAQKTSESCEAIARIDERTAIILEEVRAQK